MQWLSYLKKNTRREGCWTCCRMVHLFNLPGTSNHQLKMSLCVHLPFWLNTSCVICWSILLEWSIFIARCFAQKYGRLSCWCICSVHAILCVYGKDEILQHIRHFVYRKLTVTFCDFWPAYIGIYLYLVWFVEWILNVLSTQ